MDPLHTVLTETEGSFVLVSLSILKSKHEARSFDCDYNDFLSWC